MTSEILDHLFPGVPILRWRDVLPVPERMDCFGIRAEFPGHKTQLDERADFILEESIVNLIDIRKVVDRLAVLIFVVQTDFVVKYCVEADILEVGNAFGLAKIVPVTLSKGEY